MQHNPCKINLSQVEAIADRRVRDMEQHEPVSYDFHRRKALFLSTWASMQHVRLDPANVRQMSCMSTCRGGRALSRVSPLASMLFPWNSKACKYLYKLCVTVLKMAYRAISFGKVAAVPTTPEK
jgi:hypothetical protein